MSADVGAKLTQQILADGTLGSVTMTASIETNLVGGGTARAIVHFNGDFETAAPTIEVIGTAATQAHGSVLLGGGATIVASVDCESDSSIDATVQSSAGASGGAAGIPMDASDSKPLGGTVAVTSRNGGLGFCSVDASLATSASTNRPGGATDNGSAKATISLTILAGAAPSPTPGACELSGTVRDGTPAPSNHDDALAGILVELVRDGNPIGDGVPTDAEGRYCIPGGTADPGPAKLRATLIDASRTPSEFQTRHVGNDDAVSVDLDIDASRFGRTDVDLAFTPTADRPWLADVAAIHRESTRFVDWLFDTLLLNPATIPPFTIITDDSDRSNYTRNPPVVHISHASFPFAARDGAWTNAPENAEWHEIGHHVGFSLGIAVNEATGCADQINHGGWQNASTCDSLKEGFAIFISALASLDIDAGRPGGYGTPWYAGFGSLEASGWFPSTSENGAGGEQIYREDLAVASLLWDLVDDTPAEQVVFDVHNRDEVAMSQLTRAKDSVAIPGQSLIRILAGAKPASVVDVYQAIRDDPGTAPANVDPAVDIDNDGTADLSPLDVVFVSHEFYGWRVHTLAYGVGVPIAFTQPGENRQVIRRNLEELSGSAVKLVNLGPQAATVHLRITYPSTTETMDVIVPAASNMIVHVELPPPWQPALASGAAIPPCASTDPNPVTLELTSGVDHRTISSCDYLHAVATTTSGVALTFEIEPSSADASGPLPTTILGLIVAVAVGLFLFAVILVTRRRRRTKSVDPA